jgi:hypothetical protein
MNWEFIDEKSYTFPVFISHLTAFSSKKTGIL